METTKTLSSKQSLRDFSKIPIFIVENHNEVLEFIYRCFGSRHLPLQNNIIIHFDSHPDMTIPRNMPSQYVKDKYTLLDELSIENWIMPCAYAGHITNLVWIKPHWATQIPNGNYEFFIGENSGLIKTNSNLEYFFSEGSYHPATELENKKLIKLSVKTMAEEEINVLAELELSNAENYILDIDLDFFSTHNPFRSMYEKANLFKYLSKIYCYDELNENDSVEQMFEKSKKREIQLNYLEQIFEYLEKNRKLDGFAWRADYDNTELKEILQELIKNIEEHYNEIDWILVNNAGCTYDKIELPHHESTDDEINYLIIKFEEFLKLLPFPPKIITISRSTEDDYCPMHQVEKIQKFVLDSLKKVFNKNLSENPILRYEEAEWEDLFKKQLK